MDAPGPSSAELDSELPDEEVAPLELDAADAWLQRLARRLVRDEEEARDLAQETWLAALRTPPRPGELRAWLTATARKLAARRWRRREGPLDGNEAHLLDEEEPSTRAARSDSARHLHSALSELSERDRRILIWRWHEGLSYTEIAARLELTRQSATYRVDRALDSLRTQVRRRASGASLLGLAPMLGGWRPTTLQRSSSVAWVAVAGALAAMLVAFVASSSSPRTTLAGGGGVPELTDRAGFTTLESGAFASVPDDVDPGNTRLAALTNPSALAAIPTVTQPAVLPDTDAVIVTGTWTIDGSAPTDWEVMLIPITPGQRVLRPEGLCTLEDDGALLVRGAASGAYELRVRAPLTESGQGYVLALGTVASEAEVLIDVETGMLRVKGSSEERLWVQADGYFGTFTSWAEVQDGVASFPSVPAGWVRVYSDQGYMLPGAEQQLGAAQLSAGQELVIEL